MNRIREQPKRRQAMTGFSHDTRAVGNTYAPKILGGDDGIPICRGPGPQLMKDCIRATNIRVRRFDDDVMIEAYIEKQ